MYDGYLRHRVPEMLELYAKGLTVGEITAQLTDVNPAMCRYILRREGVLGPPSPIRPPKARPFIAEFKQNWEIWEHRHRIVRTDFEWMAYRLWCDLNWIALGLEAYSKENS